MNRERKAFLDAIFAENIAAGAAEVAPVSASKRQRLEDVFVEAPAYTEKVRADYEARKEDSIRRIAAQKSKTKGLRTA